LLSPEGRFKVEIGKPLNLIGRGIMMNDQAQARKAVSEVPRRTIFDWDNYLVEKIAELRQLVDEYNIGLGGNINK